jgi:formylmethanofuran dehydrogenase subunit B
VTPAATITASAADRRVCTACSLLCDDVAARGGLLVGACATGQAAWEAAQAADREPEARIDGLAATRITALDVAADRITAARRVLVTGLGGLPVDAIAAACDLAEAVGAAIDAGDPECSSIAGPTIARVGSITAAWEELRDRADLVVFWFCDPVATHPRFLERFVTPPPTTGLRRTIAIGPTGVMSAGATHDHVPLAIGSALPAARMLEALFAGSRPPGQAALVTLLEPLRRAIAGATCTALVTTPGDTTGLDGWSVASLVRSLALRQPAFEIPLAGARNTAAAAAVCTWRYGAAGAIGRADRRGASFLPAEADAARLIARGEVDCVVVVGDASSAVEAALTARDDATAVVRVSPASPADRGVHVRCTDPLRMPQGAMLRGDGRWMPLSSEQLPPTPGDADAVVRGLLERLARVGRTGAARDGGPSHGSAAGALPGAAT